MPVAYEYVALSTLQYKDSVIVANSSVENLRLIYSKYSTNLYRSGNLNMPVRMRNILSMSPQPNFVEIITWVYHSMRVQHDDYH